MSEPEHPDDPYVPEEALPPKPGREKAMGFWEHLEELRSTLIKSGVVFVICAIGVAYFLKEFNHALMTPFLNVKAEYPELEIELGSQTIMDPFNIIIQMCVFGGLALALPFILIFVGQFVAPALTEKEMKAVLPMAISAMLLFLAGAVFSYFLLVPATIRTSIESAQLLGLVFRWQASSYYSTLMWLVFGVGIAFEFPLVIVLMVWLGIMTTAFLRKYRKHAIVVIFIIAALVTPTPDVFVQTIFAAPLYLLYEIAILVSARIERRREQQLAA